MVTMGPFFAFIVVECHYAGGEYNSGPRIGVPTDMVQEYVMVACSSRLPCRP